MVFAGFGNQVGRENRGKVEEKVHWKYEAKQERLRTRLGAVPPDAPRKRLELLQDLSGKLTKAEIDEIQSHYLNPQMIKGARAAVIPLGGLESAARPLEGVEPAACQIVSRSLSILKSQYLIHNSPSDICKS